MPDKFKIQEEKDRLEKINRRKKSSTDLLEITRHNCDDKPYNRNLSIITTEKYDDKDYSGKYCLSVSYCNTYFNDSEALLLRDWLNSKIQREKNYSDNKKVLGDGFICIINDNCMEIFTESINPDHYNLLNHDLAISENSIFFDGNLLDFFDKQKIQKVFNK